MILLSVFVVLALLNLFLNTFAVRLGSKWARNVHASWGRCFAATLLATAISIALVFVPAGQAASSVPGAIFFTVLQYAAMLLSIYFLLIPRTFGKALLTTVPVIGLGIIMLGLALGVVRPFVAESFVSPMMGMAPAIRAEHTKGTCTTCGSETIVNIPRDRFSEPFALCVACLGSSPADRTTKVSEQIYSADRFLVNKLRSPTRFDIVAHRVTEYEHASIWLQRIVGLPGETVVVDRGTLLINGQSVALPDAVKRIRFGESTGMRAEFATQDQPLKLGTDEYFVIGDNQQRSHDSRFRGPIFGKDIVGVAEVIYWPPSRVGSLR